MKVFEFDRLREGDGNRKIRGVYTGGCRRQISQAFGGRAFDVDRRSAHDQGQSQIGQIDLIGGRGVGRNRVQGMEGEMHILELYRFRQRQCDGEIRRVDLQRIDGGVQVPSDRASLEPDGHFP